MTKDQVLIRAKDVGLLISVVTLIGLLFGPLRKVFILEQTISDVAELKSGAIETKTEIAVINAHYSDIGKQLEQINWQLRRIRDDRR